MTRDLLRAVVPVSAGLKATAGARPRRRLLIATLGGALVAAPSFFGATAASRRPLAAAEATTRQTPGRPLPSVGACGVATRPVLRAADAFLATLDPDQRAGSPLPTDDAEWLDRVNVPSGSRPGFRLDALAAPQRAAALALIRASLAADGLANLEGVERLRQALADGADHFELLGAPAPDAAWGWQLDGPGLIVNYFVAGDHVVITPTRIGESPTALAANSP